MALLLKTQKPCIGFQSTAARQQPRTYRLVPQQCVVRSSSESLTETVVSSGSSQADEGVRVSCNASHEPSPAAAECLKGPCYTTDAPALAGNPTWLQQIQHLSEKTSRIGAGAEQNHRHYCSSEYLQQQHLEHVASPVKLLGAQSGTRKARSTEGHQPGQLA